MFTKRFKTMATALKPLPIAAAIGLLAFGAPSYAADQEPIKIGVLHTASGPWALGKDTTQPVIDFMLKELNDAGGINGRPVIAVYADDGGDPQKSQQLARQLIDSENVVSIIMQSVPGCTANAAYFEEKDVAVVADAAQPSCFTARNIATVNGGPQMATQSDLFFATGPLGKERVCAFYPILPGAADGWKISIAEWEKATGKKVAFADFAIPFPLTNWTPYLLKAKAEKCDAIVTVGGSPMPNLMKAAVAQGMGDIPFFFQAPTYQEGYATALKGVDAQVYVNTNYEPFDDPDNPKLAGWWHVVNETGTKPEFASQSMYVAARMTIEVLKTVEDPVTTESVTEAFRSMEPIEEQMVGKPWVFGPGDHHVAENCIKFVKAVDGKWQAVDSDWVCSLDE